VSSLLMLSITSLLVVSENEGRICYVEDDLDVSKCASNMIEEDAGYFVGFAAPV
jgi:hypothetical protein